MSDQPAEWAMQKSREIVAEDAVSTFGASIRKPIIDGEMYNDFPIILIIARALEAADKVAREQERERCAKIAINLGASHFTDCERLGFMDPETGIAECSMKDCLCIYRDEAGEEIAASIRKGAEQ